MNNRKLLIFASFLLLAGCTTDPDMDNNVGGGTSAQTPSAKIVNTSADAAAETLLVYFNDRAVESIESTAAATRTAATRSGVASVDDVLSRLEIVSLERLFTYDARSEEQTRAAGLHKWYILTFGQGADLEKAARELAGVAEVSRIQFDTKLQKASVGNPMPFRIDETGTTRADFSGSGFNDPGLPNQWHYSNNGDKMFAATTAAGADINVPEAWKLTGGSPSIIVAIVDEGVKYTHPDLAANMWVNPNPSPEFGNQDIHGWNFLGNAVGESLRRAGTEPFREYKRLRPRFKDADTSRLTLSAKAEYAYYKQMERAARLDTYIKFTEYQRIRSDAFRICDSLMRLKYGDRETTVADFQRLELADTTGLALPLSIAASTPVMFTPDMPWHEAVEKIDSEYRLSAVRVASLDSLNDDPHIKLGNRPDDFRNFRYGNNLIGDDPYHGTMVAGVIAACAATAGELPRPVKILSVRAIPEGDEYDRDVAAAIRYAVDNGAEVVNMSFGKYLSPHRDEVLAAMKYARSKDVLLVMASGNDGVNVDVRPIFPTCRDTKGRRLENQIVVGASTPDGRVASFSNYGAENVDLLAPGENVRSTAPEGGYDTAQGTSIAAPIVSGVAAVLRSFYPDLSAREIREILIRTVTHFPADEMPVPGKSETSRMIQGRQVCLGGGILNAQAAMKEASKISKFGER